MRVLLIALLAAISYAQTEDSFCSEHIPVNGAESARVLNDGNYIVGELKFGSDDPTSNVYKVDSETKEVSIYCTVPYKAALGAFVTEDVVYIACTSYGYSALCMCNDDGYVRSIHMEDVKTANDLMVMNNKVYMTDTSLDSEFNALGSSQLVIVDLQDETYRKLELTSYGVTGANGIVQSPSGTIIIADALGDGILIELTESGEFISSYPLEIFGDGIQWSQALNAYVMGRVTSEGVVMVDESLTKVQHISDEPCNAIGIDEEKMHILCPSLYDNRLTLIDMSPECGINAISEEPTCEDDDESVQRSYGITCATVASFGLCGQVHYGPEGEGTLGDMCTCTCGDGSSGDSDESDDVEDTDSPSDTEAPEDTDAPDVCQPVVCGCAPGLLTVEEVDESGCVTSCSCVTDCPPVVCVCMPGQTVVESIDEDGCSTCSCAPDTTTMAPVNGLGDACGFVFGRGDVGECDEGLVCACVGPCADPMIADYPSTCVQEADTTQMPSCPEVMCSCPQGQNIVPTFDTNGCLTCGCEDIPCPEVMCSCPEGQNLVPVQDSNGCEVCYCQDACPEVMCSCPEGQNIVPITDVNGCDTCYCQDAPETGDYTCGTTMEECEAAYQAAMTPVVEVMIPTMTFDSCESADGWWVAGTLNGLAGYDAETMTMCVSDGQYMVEVDGKVYATCVAYGTPNQDTCGDESLVCPSLPSDSNVFGWGGNQRSVLAAAMSRADFKHPECPTSTCMSMDSLADSGTYWKDQVLSNPYTTVTEAAVDNVCVTPYNEVMMITREGMCNTCLGWSSVATDICDTQKFICAGHSGQGEFTYGWPGQIARTLAVAVANEEGNYMHPQCPVNICSA